MTLTIEKFNISTKGFNDFLDITPKIQDYIYNLNSESAFISINVVSSCASILIIKEDRGLLRDLSDILENIIPINQTFSHDENSDVQNANARLKAAIIGNSVNLCAINKKLKLDSNDRIVLVDFDNKTNVYEILVSMIY